MSVIFGVCRLRTPIPFVEKGQQEKSDATDTVFDGRVTCECLRPCGVHLCFSMWHFRCAILRS